MAYKSDNYVMRPASSGAAVTPHDTNNLTTEASKGLYVGGTGNLRVMTADGTELTFNSVPVGLFPVAVKRVYSTSTTATNIVALY